MENNQSDVNFSSGIQRWELDSATATKQQLYLVENMHVSIRIITISTVYILGLYQVLMYVCRLYRFLLAMIFLATFEFLRM